MADFIPPDSVRDAGIRVKEGVGGLRRGGSSHGAPSSGHYSCFTTLSTLAAQEPSMSR